MSEHLTSRKCWIAHTLRSRGKLIIDDGARIALCEHGKSLLPSGITAVDGTFRKGDTVAVLDRQGREIARGMTNYSAAQVLKIKGLKSTQIAKALGESPYDEVIHRNNMTLR
ncbi:MAG TPA: hypothetical protein DCX07_15400 [Phycisphaerales bacterium]|nr:hypothetical protein [Phycisphaerales bacterium]